MSFDEYLDKRLNQLKRAYENQPQMTNVNELVSKITIKKRKVFLPYVSAAAAAFALCMFIFATPLIDQNLNQDEALENFSDDGPRAENEKLIKNDFIEPEGIKEAMTFYFVKHEQLNFSTYYPEDMLVQEEKEKLRFYANFGNVEEKNAYVDIYKLDGDVFHEQKKRVEDVFHDYTFVEKQKSDFLFPFSEQEFSFQKGEFYGLATVFQRDGQFFGAIIHFPAEYEEGLMPRAAKILTEVK